MIYHLYLCMNELHRNTKVTFIASLVYLCMNELHQQLKVFHCTQLQTYKETW